MNQVKQIYFKDLRHYWPYAAASLALLVVYARNDMHSWSLPFGLTGYSGAGVFSIAFLSKTVTVLIPIAWALLIVLAVQADSLVGDRQFWITRPYDWKSLLAAKALFMLTVIHAPLLIVDVFLLAKAGFAPTHYIVGLLWMQGMMTLILVLPCLALAVITRSVPQLLLAVAAVVLFIVGMIWLATEFPNLGPDGAFESIQEILFVGACVAVILIQYARRWTPRSRIIILGLAGATLLLMVATPRRTISSREFPPLPASDPAALQLTVLPPKPHESGSRPANQEDISIEIPFSVSGVAANSMLHIDGYTVQVNAPGAPSWNSGWNYSSTSIFPDTATMSLTFSMKKKSFVQLQSLPGKLKLAIAFTAYRNSSGTEFVIPPEEFHLQELGPCRAGGVVFRQIQCLAPLHGPRSLLLTTDLSRSTCPLRKEESRYPAGTLGRDWSTSDSGPAEFGLSPVQEVNLGVSIYPSADLRGSAGWCPGTSIAISNPVLVRRNQVPIVLDNFRVSDYRLYPFDSDGSYMIVRPGNN